MELNEPTEKIIDAAHKVLFALKPGFDERLYERALAIELSKQGHGMDGGASSRSRSPCAS